MAWLCSYGLCQSKELDESADSPVSKGLHLWTSDLTIITCNVVKAGPSPPAYGTSIRDSRRTARAKNSTVTATEPTIAVVYPMASSPLNGLPSMPCMMPMT